MDFEQILRQGWCCSCGKRMDRSQDLNVVYLNKLADWSCPSFNGRIIRRGDQLYKQAIGIVCDICHRKDNEVKFALEIVGESRIYHKVEDLIDWHPDRVRTAPEAVHV